MNPDNSLFPKLFIIEDDPSIQMVLSKFLSKTFELNVFGSAADALSFLHQGSIPDIIISDLNIPEISGLELLKQVKSSGFFKDIPVVMLSGEDNSETRIKCYEAGAEDYIVKPFSPKELEVRLKLILKRNGKLVA
ncbi:Response regulator receiver domain-containing protein [Filimonas lacunae]|uniref:Response regulator receiver domain-containing protein n=1 Tax=Filimonas lacunae TaxID=477680 RepID=A0A173MRG0_9BACT|nr:response regulator transcription factor [Filimonas lacunae]BAV10244.1 two-component system response regulator [Filimonas lacunae]SIT17878.1 Response regulator receiver domain-containing protein [Filimonas lacunae]